MNPKDIVQQVTDKWRTAFNSGKASEVAACYTEEGFFSSPRTPPLSGRKAIEDHVTQLMQGAQITIGVQDAKSIGNNMCVAVGGFSTKGPQGTMTGHWGLTMVGNEIALHVSNYIRQ